MKDYSQKWAVAAFFEELPEGYTFHKSDVPLHITLAGVFAIDLSGKEIATLLTEQIHSKSFSVKGGDIEQWGSLKVTRIKYSEDLEKLYRAVQKTLLDNGAFFNEQQYLLDGFKTHSTHQKIGVLDTDETVDIMDFSLVDMFPDSNGEMRRITAVFRLL